MSYLVGTWNLDNDHSIVEFSVKHAGITNVKGRFNTVEATVIYTDNENPVVTAVIDVDSINTNNKQRDDHLLSEDFFNVILYPNIKFNGEVENNKLIGTVYIKGIEKEIVFNIENVASAVDALGHERIGVSANTTISRKDFGLTWNKVLEGGGVLISDTVKIQLDLSFIK